MKLKIMNFIVTTKKFVRKSFGQLNDKRVAVGLLSILASIAAIIGAYYSYVQAMDTRVIDYLNEYKLSQKSFVSVNVPDSIIQKYPKAITAKRIQDKILLFNQYIGAIELGNLRENEPNYSYISSTLESIQNIINKEGDIRSEWHMLVVSAIAENMQNTVSHVVNLRHFDNYNSSYTNFVTLFEKRYPKICYYIECKNIKRAKKLLYDVLDSKEFCAFITETKDINQDIFNYSNTIISEYAVNGKL